MAEVSTDQLQQAVEGLHECHADYLESIHVVEKWEGETVWEGPVAVFSLRDHPTAETCYAWSEPVDDSERRRFLAVLREGAIQSPEDAVKAAIAHDHGER